MTPTGATPIDARAVAPDLARGAMLLLIALANAHVWLWGRPSGIRGYPLDLDGLDRVVTALQMTLVDGRAYPMFALLFGYGITQLAARRAAVGAQPDEIVRLVRRRGGWMVAIGMVHGVALWSGDIVGAYGLVAVLMAGVLVRGAPGTLVGLAVAGTTICTALSAFGALTQPGATTMMPSVAVADPRIALVFRAVEWMTLSLVVTVVVVFGAVALGAWAARRRLLDDPARHRPLLVRLAVAGLAAAVLGGLPLGLVVAGVWAPSVPVLLLCGALHTVGGYAGGVGYAALFGLLAIRSDHRTARSSGPVENQSETGAAAQLGPVGRAVQACGQRSLSCYLAQSVAFAALMPAWSLGLGARLTVAQTALVAFAVWVVILVVAAASARAGLRGPAEVLLRRLTYGPSGSRTTRRPAVGRRPAGTPLGEEADQALLHRGGDQDTVAGEEPPGGQTSGTGCGG